MVCQLKRNFACGNCCIYSYSYKLYIWQTSLPLGWLNGSRRVVACADAFFVCLFWATSSALCSFRWWALNWLVSIRLVPCCSSSFVSCRSLVLGFVYRCGATTISASRGGCRAVLFCFNSYGLCWRCRPLVWRRFLCIRKCSWRPPFSRSSTSLCSFLFRHSFPV